MSLFDKILGKKQDGEDHILHPIYGQGVILRSKSMGFRIIALFEDGIERKVRADEVTMLQSPSPLPVHQPEMRTYALPSVKNNSFSQSIVQSIGIITMPTLEEKGHPISIPASEATDTARSDTIQFVKPIGPDMIGPAAITAISPDHQSTTRNDKNNPSMYANSPDPMDFQAREIIEALRIGVAPRATCGDFFDVFTVGRDEDLMKIQKWLKIKGKGGIVVSGDYGTGKTHLIECASSKALRERWATSRVEIDIHESPFSNPKSVYTALVRGFHYIRKDGSIGDFRDFLQDCANSPKKTEIARHTYLSKIIERIKEDAITDSYYLWIEGRGDKRPEYEWVNGFGFHYIYQDQSYPALQTACTAANQYCYLINGISYACHEILGLNGLFVLFDEAESIDKTYYSNHRDRMGTNFLNGLYMLASDDSRLLEERDEQGRRYVHVNWSDGVGYDTGLRYSKQTFDPFAFELPSNLKLLFCLTPVDYILSSVPFVHMQKVALEPLPSELYEGIFRNIESTYERAYQFKLNGYRPSNFDIEEWFQMGLRTGIKSSVDAIDLIRLKPGFVV